MSFTELDPLFDSGSGPHPQARVWSRRGRVTVPLTLSSPLIACAGRVEPRVNIRQKSPQRHLAHRITGVTPDPAFHSSMPMLSPS